MILIRDMTSIIFPSKQATDEAEGFTDDSDVRRDYESRHAGKISGGLNDIETSSSRRNREKGMETVIAFLNRKCSLIQFNLKYEVHCVERMGNDTTGIAQKAGTTV